MLLEKYCRFCGETSESRLFGAGAMQIRESCGECGQFLQYIAFYEAFYAVPEVKAIRAEIWTISKQDLKVIEAAKKAIGFEEKTTDIWRRLEWYRLYREVFDIMALASTRYDSDDDEINF